MKTIVFFPQANREFEFDMDTLAIQPNGSYALVKGGQMIAVVPPSAMVYHPDGPAKIIEATVIS